MKLAISNIAWTAEEDAEIAESLKSWGIEGLEIAPTRVWERPLEAPASAVDDFRKQWEARGVPIVAMQSLLFGRPDLVMFGESHKRQEMLEYLKGIMELAARVGAKALVFGSPKNRQRGAMSWEQAAEIAAQFFSEAGAAAETQGIYLCIEPNAQQYGCDFLMTTEETLQFLDRVPSAGVGLHLDAAMLKLNAEDPRVAVERGRARMKHFHISEPSLAVIGSGGSDHAATAAALKATGYTGWRSIEMRAGERGTNAANVQAAIAAARRYY